VATGTNLSKSGNVLSTISSPSFSSVMISNTPTASTDGTNKSYVDSQITANTISAGNQLSKTGNTLNVSATPSFTSVSIANAPAVGTELVYYDCITIDQLKLLNRCSNLPIKQQKKYDFIKEPFKTTIQKHLSR